MFIFKKNPHLDRRVFKKTTRGEVYKISEEIKAEAEKVVEKKQKSKKVVSEEENNKL